MQEANAVHSRELRTVFVAFLLDPASRKLLEQGKFATCPRAMRISMEPLWDCQCRNVRRSSDICKQKSRFKTLIRQRNHLVLRDSNRSCIAACCAAMRIKCAAIRQRGKVVATGLSHEAAKLAAGGITGEHGFLTDKGDFVSRERAGEIALASGQAKELSNPSFGLSSTDLEHDYPLDD